MILHYLKVALRNLLKYRTHSCISVICLAVGIAFFTLVSHFINGVKSDQNLPRAEEKVRFFAMRDNHGEFMSWEDVRFLQSQQIAGLDSLYASSFSSQAEVTLFDNNQNEHPHLVTWSAVSPNCFASYGYELLAGSRTLMSPDEVVVSEHFARRVLGEDSPVGLILRVDAGFHGDTSIKNFKIVNVVRAEKPRARGDLFFHPEAAPRLVYNAGSFLNGKATLQEVNEQLGKVVWPEGRITSCRILMEQRDDVGRNLAYLLVRVIASLILLSGLINFLKFIIQMFYNRQRELGIRQCLGSDWKGLFSLLFAEVFWMMSAALFLSLCLSEIIIAFIINHLLPAEKMIVSFSMEDVTPLQCLVYVGVLVLCMVIILFPVYKLRKSSVIRPTRRSNKHLFRYTMIGVQLAISVFFVGGVWVINQFFYGMRGTTYDPLTVKEEKQILSIPVTSSRLLTNWDLILKEVQELPGYEEFTHFASESNFLRRLYMTYQKNDKESAAVLVQQGDPKSFDFFHIPLQGDRDIAANSSRIYVSEQFMQRLQADDNTGTVRLHNNDYQIAGVYKDLYKQRTQEMDANYVGTVFIPNDGKSNCFLKFAAGTDMDAVRREVEAICRKYVPHTLPLEVIPLDEVSDEEVDAVLMMIRCGMLLGVVSLILVVLSIYSAISIDTVGRQKEIAIRKINGATSRNIASLFAKPYVAVYLLSFVCVIPLLRLLLIMITDGYLGIAYRWDWVIGLFICFALLLFAVTAQKIRYIMHINPGDIIKKE